ATIITEAVFFIVRKIGVGRAVNILYMAVIRAFLIGIFNYKTNWRTRGFSFKNSGKKLHFIFFPSLGNDSRLAGLAALHFCIYCFKIKGKSGWATVNNSTNCRAVRFAEGGESKDFSEGIARHIMVF